MMQPAEFHALADRLELAARPIIDAPLLDAAVAEAAEMLRLIAPAAPALGCMVGGLIRHRVSERRRENERRMTDELARVLTKLAHGPTRMADQIEAARLLDCYRDYRDYPARNREDGHVRMGG